MPKKNVPPVAGVVLTVLRANRGWTQKDLCVAADLPHGFVSDYELGRRPLRRDLLERFAEILGYEQESVIDVMLAAVRRLRFVAEPRESPRDLSTDYQRSLEAALAKALADAELVGREYLRGGFVTISQREDRGRAEELLEILRPHTLEDRAGLVERSLELRSWALCERICAESAKAAAADAREALDWANLALKIATLTWGGEPWRSHLQGYAWAFVGNARRVANDLRGADEAFANSRRLWEAGLPENAGILDESRMLDLEASLRKDQRRWPEALDLLDRAQEATSTENARARLLLNKAFTLEQMGDYQGAINAIRRIQNVGVEPRVLFGARFNLAVNYCHLGKHGTAASLLPQIQRLARQLGNGLDLIRTVWLEGRIAAGLGRKLEAIPALERAREEFANRGLGCDMALVSLELAVLYLEEGHFIKVRELARQMVTLLQSQDIQREMLAALKLFYDAAERREATVELARRLMDYLHRAQLEPELKFQG
jgi:tetratricopeptide (TPR) repeat protein/transcriptional regulator with XRE-family HTH domain